MIDKYLISNCLFIIDEFNERYKNLDSDSLRVIANNEYAEADIAIKLGYQFRNMANFNFQGRSSDIVIKSKDFIIEVKYLRNFKSKFGTYTNKMTWHDAFEKNYSWLSNEVQKGKKGNRAFVIGWFNAVDRFSEIMQLGEGNGNSPNLNIERSRYFPFLNRYGDSKKTKDIFYMYSNAYKEMSIPILGYSEESINCVFIGKEEDKFHFCIYY
ncbi:hypothetical protein GCM10008905_16490 [Clostridium malenominatum]|uniref:Restriction endonuclease n=1 Tax=Clostridium malenominatum TaxID=1539 RepID=A0ABN1IYD1_9CLOT